MSKNPPKTNIPAVATKMPINVTTGGEVIKMALLGTNGQELGFISIGWATVRSLLLCEQQIHVNVYLYSKLSKDKFEDVHFLGCNIEANKAELLDRLDAILTCSNIDYVKYKGVSYPLGGMVAVLDDLEPQTGMDAILTVIRFFKHYCREIL